MLDEGLASLIPKLREGDSKAEMRHLDIKDANFLHRGFGILNPSISPGALLSGARSAGRSF